MRYPVALAMLLVGGVASEVYGQVSLDESATRASLVQERTAVSLAFKNRIGAVDALVRVEWLDPSNRVLASAEKTASIAPGNSQVAIALPLPATEVDLRLLRLRYTFVPRAGHAVAVPSVTGILSFVNLASYAFSLEIMSPFEARPGAPFEISVLTLHPTTHEPVANVRVEGGDAKATTDRYGMAILRPKLPSGYDGDEITVTARLGDFVQRTETSTILSRNAIRIETDKPLYQPGQTLHIRTLSFGSDRRVRAQEQQDIHVFDADGNLAHTASETSSRYGIASIDWSIPSNAKPGKYRIEATSDDANAPAERTIEIRAYDLPSFRVLARTAQPYYLPGEPAAITVSAEYLFGRPVARGRAWIEVDGETKPVWSGELNADGAVQTSLPMEGIDIPQNGNFVDRHYIAFVTDPTTNRTEQRKFDVRLSRSGLHLYVLRREALLTGERFYFAAYLPDGTRVRALVHSSTGTQCATNRFGLCRFEIPYTADAVEFYATNPAGARSQTLKENLGQAPALVLETDRALYRKGSAVNCHIAAKDHGARVLLFAWNARWENVFSRAVALTDGAANVEIPYETRFGDRLSVAAVAGGFDEMASTDVLFPGGAALHVTVKSAKDTYRPGETARIDFRASAQAVLGIAVVDQSVFERAETDSIVETTTDDVSAQDLTHLDPAKIDDDYQLLARALSSGLPLSVTSDDWLSTVRTAFAIGELKTLAPLKRQLDDQYGRSLEYPRDEGELYATVYNVKSFYDPWGQPFYPVFRTEGSDDVLCLTSAGPDKQAGTNDDACAMAIRRPWFGLHAALIKKALAAESDFPATKDEFERRLQSAGLLFTAFRDRWERSLAVEISDEGASRDIEISSAGPDGKWGTADDVPVANFRGTYFSRNAAAMRKIFDASKRFPLNSREALDDLKAAGFAFDTLHDRWGRALTLDSHVEERFADNISFYTFAEYKQAPEQRQKITPVKIRLAMIDVQSNGEDGIRGTFDDFKLASFARLLKEDAPAPRGASTSVPIDVPGKAIITGVVRDRSGATVPNASVYLDGVHAAHTGADGVYVFSGVPAGAYELKVTCSGFQVFILAHVPAMADQVTKADVVLEVGSVSQSVEVSAAPATVYSTMSAEVSQSKLGTPRVREYFPETLFWQPELVTDAHGSASLNLKLADSVTTWKVGVVASTEDGELTETTAAVRAFQPFLVDLDVPKVLTEGDRISLPVPIRNYLDRTQTVRVAAATTRGLSSTGSLKKASEVAASSALNVVFDLRADAADPAAKVKITAIGGNASDAIEKPIAIHPDGQRLERSAANLLSKSGELSVALPAQIIPGSAHAEVRIYPGVISRIVEAVSVLLERPSGCAEQTISSSYPNLLLLRALHDAHVENQRLQAKARKNLQSGYDRLLGYQAESGGFTYWGKGDTDVALTAYAVQFLRDARAFLSIDEDHFQKAQRWLALQKADDSKVQAWQLEGLLGAAQGSAFEVNRRLAELAHAAARFNDPYAAAQFALAAMEAERPELARESVQLLVTSAQPANGAVFWSLIANTPFHGWGHSGQVETTALAVRALTRWRKQHPDDTSISDALERGALYLLRSTSAGGAWATSQSTVQALLALMETWRPSSAVQPAHFTVRIGGAVAGELASGAGSEEPLTLDVSRFLKPGEENRVQISSSLAGRPFQAQYDVSWYQPWQIAKPAAADIAFRTDFDRPEAAIGDSIACHIEVERPNFRGYGMLIARIGLPPGAEVDRGTLAAAVADPKAGVDSFEVAPDGVTFYLWPRAAASRFSFVFRPRFAIQAKSADSVAYDYYNPDDRIVLSPRAVVVH